MSKTLKMLKNTKKRGDFTKGGWEMFERENIALRKKKYQFIRKQKQYRYFSVSLKSSPNHCIVNPGTQRENYEIGSLELQKIFLTSQLGSHPVSVE